MAKHKKSVPELTTALDDIIAQYNLGMIKPRQAKRLISTYRKQIREQEGLKCTC